MTSFKVLMNFYEEHRIDDPFYKILKENTRFSFYSGNEFQEASGSTSMSLEEFYDFLDYYKMSDFLPDLNNTTWVTESNILINEYFIIIFHEIEKIYKAELDLNWPKSAYSYNSRGFILTPFWSRMNFLSVDEELLFILKYNG